MIKLLPPVVGYFVLACFLAIFLNLNPRIELEWLSLMAGFLYGVGSVWLLINAKKIRSKSLETYLESKRKMKITNSLLG